MAKLINDGHPTNIWHGYSHNRLLHLCHHARELQMEDEADAMGYAAAGLVAGECTEAEWDAGEKAARAVEKRLCDAWEAEHGEPRRNRYGQYWGGRHPALA